MAAGDKNELQVKWPTAADSKSVAASGNETSEAITFSAAEVSSRIQLKANNGGTPASGDTVEFYWVAMLGDPDGASTDEYATAGHGEFLAVLDTDTENPAIAVVDLPGGDKGGKIYAVNNSSGRAITVSACIYEAKAT